MRLRRAAMAVALLAISNGFVLVRGAHANAWSLAPGEYYTELKGTFFSSSSYYDENSDRLELGGLSERRTLESYSEFGWKKRINFLIGVPAVSTTNRQSPGTLLANQTGYGDVHVGFKFRLANGEHAAAVTAEWMAPLGYNRRLGAPLGDGLQTLGVKLELGSTLARHGFLQAGGGYEYRFLAVGARKDGTEDPAAPVAELDWADHLTADVDLGLWLGRSLLVAGRFRGAFPIQEGPAYGERTMMLAGPAFIWRVDDGMDVIAGSWSTPGGTNTLHYDQYYFGFAFRKNQLNRLQGFLGGTK